MSGGGFGNAYYQDMLKYSVEFNSWTFLNTKIPFSMRYGRTIYFNGIYILFGVCFRTSGICPASTSYILKYDGTSWRELKSGPGNKYKKTLVIPYLTEYIY